MSHRPNHFDDNELDTRPKRVRPQNLMSPGYLDSDLPSQLDLIRVREDTSTANAFHDGFGRGTNRHHSEKPWKSGAGEDMDIDNDGLERAEGKDDMDMDTSIEVQAKDHHHHHHHESSKYQETKTNSISEEESRAEIKFKAARNLYLSTNSPIAPNNLANPDVGEVLFCVAAVIQAQIFEDDYLPDDRKALHPFFNIIPDLPPDIGGQIDAVPERILQQESANDDALRQQLLNLVVPTIDTIVKFLALIRSRSHYSVECNIIALVYLNRMTTISRLPLTASNWRALWVTCVIIAQKFWEDNPLKTSAFSIILPSISKTQLREWERKGLDLLDYSIRVKPSLYAKYYFELRQLFVEIIGPRVKWSLKPMNRAGENKLSLKSKLIYSKDDTYDGATVDVRGLKSFKT